MKDIKNIKSKIQRKKVLLMIVFIIFILGLIFGSIYITIVDNNNKKEIMDSVKNYFYSYKNITFKDKLEIFKTTFTSSILYFLSMWLLGLCIIGIPIIIIMIFLKSFQTGFSVASIFACFKFKGLVGLFIYIFPSNILTLIFSIFLGVYSMNISIRLITNALTKKNLNFKFFMGKYFFILLISILLSVFTSFIDAFISPIFYNLFNNLLK